MAGDDEEEEELREVDPMEVVEERLMLLEAWQQEDPYNEEVEYKREEYTSLMDELEILAKKMRKTDKLLMMNNQPNRTKLERKKDQYIREVQDIVIYADQDDFFDMDGENGEAALSAYMKANSLLGKPLETLAEMPGFEDSKAWNDSSGTLGSVVALTPRMSREERKVARKEKQQKQSSASSLSTEAMDLTDPDAELLLRKKIRKVKQLLLESSTEADRKRLFKKHQQYKAKLAEATTIKRKKVDDDASSTHSTSSNESEESIDVPQRSPVKVMQNAQKRRLAADATKANAPPMSVPQSKKASDSDYALLKKKFAKALKLLKAAKSEKEKDKLERKIPEYLEGLNGYAAWDSEKAEYGYGVDTDDGESVTSEQLHQSLSHHTSSTTMTNHNNDYELLKKKLVKANKMLQKTSTSKEKGRLEKKISEYVNSLNQFDAWEQDRYSYGYGDRDKPKKQESAPKRKSKSSKHQQVEEEGDDNNTDVNALVEEQKQINKVIKRKLKKVEVLQEEMISEKGVAAKKSKAYKNLEKKRKRYLDELGEDHASLNNVSLSMSGISLDTTSSYSNDKAPLSSSALDTHASDSVSTKSIDLGGSDNWDNSNGDMAKVLQLTGKSNLDPAEEELLQKKLKKVLKLLQGTADTKEYLKLEKKRREYLSKLGQIPVKGK